MRNDYLSGASDTLEEIEERLNSSIKRNNGAKTTSDVVNVFNDVVTGIHIMRQEIKDIEESPLVILFVEEVINE